MAASRTLAAVCAASLLAVVTRGAPPDPAPPLAAAAPTGAATSDVLPFSAVEKTLGNGLKVIVVP